MTRALPALLLLFALPAAAASPATPTPRAVDQGLTLPASSASSVGGADATLVNPAGLSFLEGTELDYLHQRSVLANRVNDGFFLATQLDFVALGASLEWIRPGSGASFRRTSLSLAVGNPSLSLGATYHWYGSADSFLLDHLSSIDVGVVARPFSFLSAGFSILDVDGPRVSGLSFPRRFDAALAIRPIGERLTLSADFLADDQVGFDGAAFAYDARIRVVDGLTLLGGVTHYFNQQTFAATLGLELDTAHLGVNYAIGTDKDFTGADHTLGVRISSARHRDLKLGSARFASLDLDALLHPPSGGVLAMLSGPRADPYISLLGLLRRARSDTGIQGVVLKISGLDGGLGAAHIAELREAVAKLRQAGKPVIALLSDSDDGEYLLASACDKIYAVPEAALLINGLSSDTLFLGDLLARIGVRVDVARVGAFKNAPDQLTRNDMSTEQYQAMKAYMDTLFDHYVAEVAADRKISIDKFKSSMARGILTPEQALADGLIDGIIYPDELNTYATSALGRSALTVDDYASWDNQPERWSTLPKIALIRVAGTITEGRSAHGPFSAATAGAETIIKGIEAARDDADVRAIVVRVDSGGGSGNASNLIYRALDKAREKKPVVISMGNAAASGGYYVALGGSTVWAEPGTLTGSIGVFVIKPDFSGLMHKLSVGDVTLKQGEHADIFGIAHPWTVDEQAAMQGYVDAFYNRFITLVSKERKLDKSAVDAIARGRIWSGADAKARGLVNRLGSLDDAIADAKHRAGLDPDERAEIESFGASRSLLPLGLSEIHSESAVQEGLTQLGLEAPAAATLQALTLAHTPGVVAALPFTFTTH